MYMQEDPDTKALTLLSDTPDGPIISRLLYVHKVFQCKDHPCVIHGTPTIHALSMEPVFWNDDLECIERVCFHGVHHPDKDDEAYRISIGVKPFPHPECDGCCKGEYKND